MMQTRLYTFSGTGNSLALARQLRAALGEGEICSIAQAAADPEHRCAVDRVIVVLPVYGFGLPAVAKAFLTRLRLEGSPKVYALVNCASMSGAAVSQVEAAFQRQGVKLSGAAIFKMPSNYTPLRGAESESVQKKKFSSAAQRIDELAQVIRANGTFPIERGFILGRLLGRLAYPVFISGVAKSDRKFMVDESCNGCGRCAEICPVGNIRLEGDRPRWQGHCEQCLACLQWCPTEAIQFGKQTRGRSRYHHPEIEAKDLIAVTCHAPAEN